MICIGGSIGTIVGLFLFMTAIAVSSVLLIIVLIQ